MFHLEVVSTELVRLYSAIAEVGACQTKQDISFTLKDTLSSNDVTTIACARGISTTSEPRKRPKETVLLRIY
jgi:hypothetical protein